MALPGQKSGSVRKDGSLSKVLDDFNFEDESLYTFTKGELDNMIEELQTSSSARSPEEIDKMNFSKYQSAVKSMQFASVSSDKAVLSADEVKENEKLTDGITKEMTKLAIKSAVVFAFVHGNVTSRKCWMRISHVKDGKSKYVSFPLLNSVGSRSVLVHVFRVQISSFLKEGRKNTLATVLEKSNIKVHESKIQYLFPKGHLLANDKETIDKIRSDLNNIFQQMAKPIEQRKYELKWFTSK